MFASCIRKVGRRKLIKINPSKFRRYNWPEVLLTGAFEFLTSACYIHFVWIIRRGDRIGNILDKETKICNIGLLYDKRADILKIVQISKSPRFRPRYLRNFRK